MPWQSNKALVVFLKEMRVMGRDRRLVVSVALISLVVMPFLMGFISNIDALTGGAEPEQVSVLVLTDDPVLGAVLTRIPHVWAYYDGSMLAPPYLTIIKEGDTFRLLGESTSTRQREVAQQIQAALEAERTRLVADSLARRGIPPMVLRPYEVEYVDLASEAQRTGLLLGILVPYLAIILLVSNANRATYIAVDEKDKNTLVSLLLSNAPRGSIVLGKIFAIMVFAVGSSLLLIVGMILFANAGFSLTAMPPEAANYSLTGQQIAQLIANLTSLALFVSAIIMLLGTYARNAREAGIYTAPLIFIAIFLAVFSFSSAVFPSPAYAVPVLGNALAMKDTFLDQLTGLHLVLTLGSNLLLALVLVAATVRLYEREAVLFRR